MKAIIFVIFIVFIAIGYYQFQQLTCPLPRPELDVNKYWGRGDGTDYKPKTAIEPFEIKAKAKVIEDLKQQLNRTLNLHAPLEGIKFEYGFNTLALEKIVEFWREKYLPRWSERERFLNSFPQFTTEIQGLRIHFIHAKPAAEVAEKKKVIPLLLLHGWPGSVREFYDFIPLLTELSEMSNYAFEVVAPSLVGYGWSQAAAKPGFNAAQMAIVMRNLMLRLGFNKFLVQGGDWGSIIGSNVATLFPENVLGYHTNMCVLHTPLAMMKLFVASLFPEKFVPTKFFQEHHFPITAKLDFLVRESGYFHIQATKPDTIGTVLQTSPVGLAAYILEKFQTATGPAYADKFHALASVYTLDAVLDNIMIYYLTHSATSAGRFYAETASKEYFSLQLERVQTDVPTGCARFINDLPPALDWALRDKYTNYIHSKYFNQGGHFAALELPVMLYIDFAEFVSKIDFDKKQN